MVEKDPLSKRGSCSNCGEVDMSWDGKRWYCGVARRERKRDPRTGKRHKKAPGKRIMSSGHGLTKDEADKLKLNAKCEICGSSKRLVIDHDHATMKIRGVLCHWCNVGLGFFQDDAGKLEKAIEYLLK